MDEGRELKPLRPNSSVGGLQKSALYPQDFQCPEELKENLGMSSNCSQSDPDRKPNPGMQQNQTIQQGQEISPEMMDALQLVMDGRPAIVIVDDGKQNLCHLQNLSLPAVIGLLTIQLKAWKDKAFRS
jgi:hypothetical protein